MKLKQLFFDESNVEKELRKVLDHLHKEGPINGEDLEILALIKYKYPSIFFKYENELLFILGLFYKTKEPDDVISLLYNEYRESIHNITNHYYTPVQAQIYKHIIDNTVYTFSAPTSVGKSYLLRELLDEIENDIVIIVPSRSLISEYLITLREHYNEDNSVLILEFVDDINKAKTKKRIFVLTPERVNEIYKFKFNIGLFIFDEAQLADDRRRGINYERIVKRSEKKYPNAKKIFAHPFVENPEAIYDKFDIKRDQISDSFNQFTVGKIFLIKDEEKYFYFNPYVKEGTYKKNLILESLEEDFIGKLIKDKKTLLIYTSKTAIITGRFFNEYKQYIDLCTEISNPDALEIIDNIRDFLDAYDDKKSNIVEMLKYGIVVHHGSIPLNVRYWLEKFIREGFARICFSTSTLIYGINMPFDAIFIDTFRFNGTTEDERALQMKNLLGRSGRTNSHTNNFDYGFVIVKNSSLLSFMGRFKETTKISAESVLSQDVTHLDEFEKENIIASREEKVSDEFSEPESRVERLSSGKILELTKDFIDILYFESETIRAENTFSIEEHIRVQEILTTIFETYINRTMLKGEYNIFRIGMTIMLWIMQGESFKQILNKRYAYLTGLNERRQLKKRLDAKAITLDDYIRILSTMDVQYSATPYHIPDRKLFNVKSSFEGMNATNIDYDSIVYDTYDYIDKVVEFSLLNAYVMTLSLYFKKTNDKRALDVINSLKYGSNNEKTIFLKRYGFTEDEIQSLVTYVRQIDENEIIFDDSIKNISDEILQCKIQRYK